MNDLPALPRFMQVTKVLCHVDSCPFTGCKERQVCRRAIGDLKISEFSALDYIRTDEELRLYVAECIRLHDAKSAAALEQAEKDARRWRKVRLLIGVDDRGVFLPTGNTRLDPKATDAAVDAMKEPHA